MQSAILVIAFAARPVDGETLLAHLELWRGPAAAASPGPPAVAPAALAKIDQELRTIERLVIDYGR
jgi:hypothetical protein